MLRLAPPQVAALCEKASSEVDEGQGVQIANYLCPGNYAISGGIAVSQAAQECSHTRMSAQLIASWVFFLVAVATTVSVHGLRSLQCRSS